MNDSSSLFLLLIVLFVLMYARGRSTYFLGANMRMAASAPSHGASSPRAWGRASSKDSDPCGICLSLALSLRARILRLLGEVE